MEEEKEFLEYVEKREHLIALLVNKGYGIEQANEFIKMWELNQMFSRLEQ